MVLKWAEGIVDGLSYYNSFFCQPCTLHHAPLPPVRLLLWRFIAGIGIGIEVITIDAYITELVPSWMRGRAFAINQAVMLSAVPIVAALSWWLVPLSPHGIDGWRWVVLIGAAASKGLARGMITTDEGIITLIDMSGILPTVEQEAA